MKPPKLTPSQIWIISIITTVIIGVATVLGLINQQQEQNQFQRPDIGVNKASKTATMYAGGDIMLSRSVASEIIKRNNPNWPFENLNKLVSTTHSFAFANLETPVTTSSKYAKPGELIFNTPQDLATGLVAGSFFKVLNLANNHALDQGPLGLAETEKWLAQQGIISVGTGANLDNAWEPRVYTENGIKFAFIGASYTSYNDGGVKKSDSVARIQDTERLKQSLAKAKKIADVVVVTMHAGTEYTRQPNGAQQNFARAAIDSGADIVIGAHPHWVQTVEQYKEKYIFYSLGNLIFDQSFSRETQQGLVLKITVNKDEPTTKIASINLLPITINNQSQPRLATEDEQKQLLADIQETSLELPGYTIDRFDK